MRRRFLGDPVRRIIDKKLFLQRLLSYLLVVLITVASMSVIFFASIRMVDRADREAQIRDAQKVCSLLDEQLWAVFSSMNTLSTYSELQAIATQADPYDQDGTLHILDIIQILQVYNVGGDFTDEYVVILNNGLAVSSTSGERSRRYRQDVFRDAFNAPLEDYFLGAYHYNSVRSDIMMQTSIVTSEQCGLTLTVTLGGRISPYGCVVVFISDSTISHYVESVSRATAFLVEPGGRILGSASETDAALVETALEQSAPNGVFGKKDQQYSYCTALWESADLILVTLEPIASALTAGAYVRLVSLTAITAAALLSLCWAVFSAARSSNRYSLLLARADNMEEKIRQQANIVLQNSLYRIYSEETMDRALIKNTLDAFGMAGHQEGFTVLYIRPNEETPIAPAELAEYVVAKRTAVESFLSQFQRAFALAGSDQAVVAILTWELTNEELQALLEQLQEAGCSKETLCQGRRVVKDTQIWESYRNAKELYEHALWSGERILTEYDNKKLMVSYQFGRAEEINLMQAVKQGDSREAISRLDAILEGNSKLSKRLKDLLLANIWFVLARETEKCKLDPKRQMDAEKRFFSLRSAERYQAVRTELARLCEYYDQNKATRKAQKTSRIVSYIQEHYQEPDMSLSKLCQQFNLTETYVSRIIHEQQGESFSSYLQQVRFMHAARLLNDTDRSITDIAAATGYQSINSFGRAFKRVCGFSPAEYRDRCREDAMKKRAD